MNRFAPTFSDIRAKASMIRAKTVAVVAVAAMPALSFAQAVDPFTQAIADITAKIGTWGAALVALSAVGVAFFIAIKYVKKIPKAA